jgi:response regulator RpfG family c-di-GMP phosphodiesterase
MSTARIDANSLVDVLLVDDDDNHLVLFGIAVRESNCDVRLNTATGGEQAIDYKESPAFSMLPVMIFSGLGDKGEIERALALGASHFLAKPHNLQGYKEVVQAVWEFGIKRSGNRGTSRSAA